MHEVAPTTVRDPRVSQPVAPATRRRINISGLYRRAGITDPLAVDRMRFEVVLTAAAGHVSALLFNDDFSPPQGPEITRLRAVVDERITDVVLVEPANDDHVTVANRGQAAFRVELVLTGWQGWDS